MIRNKEKRIRSFSAKKIYEKTLHALLLRYYYVSAAGLAFVMFALAAYLLLVLLVLKAPESGAVKADVPELDRGEMEALQQWMQLNEDRRKQGWRADNLQVLINSAANVNQGR